MKKIRVIGDSLLKGVIYDEQKGKHRILKENGIQMLKEAGFDITNDAKFGLTIEKAKSILSMDQHKDYDYVILEVGGNDCDYNWDEVSEHPEKPHLTKTPIDQFEENLRLLIQMVKDMQLTPILVSIPPLDHTLFYEYISLNRKKENILSFLGDTRKIYTHQMSYNNVIRRVSLELSVRYVPLRETIEVRKATRDIYCKDGMHLNEEGQKILFETLRTYI